MPAAGKKFFAKIMLFGEYSLMYGSAALTVPFNKHSARLVFPFRAMSEKQKKSGTAFQRTALCILRFFD